MDQTRFGWSRDDMNARLLMAVGSVVTEWAMIDQRLTEAIYSLWDQSWPEDTIPRPFDKRVRILKRAAAQIYADDSGEMLLFNWFFQRLTKASGARDDICHGTLGMAEIDERSFPALMVPKPSHSTRFEPATLQSIEELHRELIALLSEIADVSWALNETLGLQRGNTIRRVDEAGSWVTITMANRRKMPATVALPKGYKG